MARDPRVSVVMITRDRCEEALASARLLRSLPEKPHVVVVDNGSVDGTARAFARYARDVELVALPHNLGAAGRNLGVQRTRTPYVAFSDDDSWWAPGALSCAADLLDADPALALVAARILVGAELRLDPTCMAMAGSALGHARRGPGVPIVGFVACGAVLRRQAFTAAGGFDPRFGVGGEEAVLALDLLHAGWRLSYFDSIVAHHHPSPVRDPATRRLRELRNALWSTWLRRPASTALHATWRAIAGDRDSRRALVEALRELPWALRNRRPVAPSVERLVRRAASSFATTS